MLRPCTLPERCNRFNRRHELLNGDLNLSIQMKQYRRNILSARLVAHPFIQIFGKHFKVVNPSHDSLAAANLIQDSGTQAYFQERLRDFNGVAKLLEGDSDTMNRLQNFRIDRLDSLHHTAVM